jgi:hypothetical protein
LILSEPPVKVPAGTQYIYEPITLDAEEDQLTFCLRTTAQGMTIDPSTGRILWSPTKEQSGCYPVAIIVSDPLGGTAEQSFTVEIQESWPACRLMYPANGAIINGTFFFRGEATGGAVPVVRVEYRVDGGEWLPANGTDRWYFGIDTSRLGNGLHTLQVRAFNDAYSTEAVTNFEIRDFQSSNIEEVHTGGMAILPLVLVIAMMGAGVVIWRKGSAWFRAGRSRHR